MAFLHFLTFQRTESRDQVICLMLDWHKHPEYVCSLSFKNVSLDSAIAKIYPQLQINVTFYELNTMRQNFINLPYPKLSLFWHPLKHENPFN